MDDGTIEGTGGDAYMGADDFYGTLRLLHEGLIDFDSYNPDGEASWLELHPDGSGAIIRWDGGEEERWEFLTLQEGVDIMDGLRTIEKEGTGEKERHP